MTDSVLGITELEAILDEALRALTLLDADAIEGLAEFLTGNSSRIELPSSAAGWKRLRSRLWVLGNLLDGTGRRIAILQRLSPVPGRLASYDVRAPGGTSLHRAIPLAALSRASKGESFRSHVAVARTAN